MIEIEREMEMEMEMEIEIEIERQIVIEILILTSIASLVHDYYCIGTRLTPRNVCIIDVS